MDNTELREWEHLIDSPGWARLVAHAKTKWDGPAFASLVESVADRGDAEALSKMRQVLAAKRAVEGLIGTPVEQIEKIKRMSTTQLTVDPAALPGLAGVSEMHRRGRL